MSKWERRSTRNGACLTGCGVSGLLTGEASPGANVTYTFTASSPGTRAYYSGTQGDLQVEMGLYGAIIVLPSNVPGVQRRAALTNAGTIPRNPMWRRSDFRLAAAAYDHPATCYDREYLFQFSEMDPNIHRQAEEQVAAAGKCVAGAPGCSLNVATEPYHPAYFMINGRSMPDDMDPNYATQYPHQPYNGDPHMHPGEIIFADHRAGEMATSVPRARQSRSHPRPRRESPFDSGWPDTCRTTSLHHYDHSRSGDGWFFLLDRQGPELGCVWTQSSLERSIGQAYVYSGHEWIQHLDPTAVNYFEWCQDHNKPLEAHPFGDVAGAGPATLPDANLFTNGAWYGGSPYLGPNATVRAVGPTGTTPPSGTIANSPGGEAGFAFMWHSHNEREITTNNIFPGEC